MSDTSNSYPHWLGLLKWSLAQTDPDGGSSDFTEMTEENRKFLDAVMKDMVKDEPGDLQKILKTFQDMFDHGLVGDDNGQILHLLEDVQLIIDQIDMANVFCKFGGAAVLKNILNSAILLDDCKCSASVICGELAQNNPTAQTEMLKSGLLDQLAVVCASPETSSKLCTKSLYGISCIIRGSVDGESRFCETLHGPVLLKRLVKRQEATCSKRVMFLANALMMSDFSTAQRVSDILSAIVPDIFSYMDSPDIVVRETFLRLLSTSVSSAAGVHILLPELSSLQNALETKLLSLTEADDEYERSQVEEILVKIRDKDDLKNVSTEADTGSDTGSGATTMMIQNK
jgi:hypothetical protein